MVKVSVIIPVYNAEKYLRKCLDSVLGQTLEDIEVIAVDDGSKDGSGAILDEYAKKDARLIVIHQKNGGVSSARNTALDIAQGEFVGFVDADDWVDDNFYETLYNTAQEKQADVVKGNLYWAYEDGKLKIDKLNKNIINNLSLHLVVNFNYAFWSAIYKNSIIQQQNIRFKNSSRSEDIEWQSQFLCKTQKYAQCDDVFYYYYQNSASVVHNVTKKHLEDLYKMCVDMYRNTESNGLNEETLLLMYRQRISELLSMRDDAAKLDFKEEYADMIKKFKRIRKYHCVIEFKLFKILILSIEEAE